MKVVVLSVCDAVDVHLIQQLGAIAPTMEIIRIVSGRSPPRIHTNFLSRVSLSKIVNRAEQIFRVWHSRRIGAEVARLLGGPGSPGVPVHHEIAHSEINDAKTVELLRSMAPDILFVSGAPILKAPVFSVSKVATINVHYGIAPHYRGEHTIFWPLYFSDYARVGVTLHRIDARIDGGQILAVACPALEPDDNEARLIAKCARLAAELAIDLVHAAYRGPLVGKTQEEKGRLFIRRDRRFWRDAHHTFLRRVLGRSLPNKTKSVIKHFETP